MNKLFSVLIILFMTPLAGCSTNSLNEEYLKNQRNDRQQSHARSAQEEMGADVDKQRR